MANQNPVTQFQALRRSALEEIFDRGMLDLEIVWETAIATITMSSAYALRYGSLQKVAQVLGSSDISILDTHGYIKIVVYNVKLPRLILDEDAASAVDPC